MSHKHTLEEIRLLFLQHNLTLLDDDYKSYNSKVKARCYCGEEFFISPANAKKGRKCSICAKYRIGNQFKLSEKEVFSFVSSKGLTIRLSNFVNLKNTYMSTFITLGDS